MIHGGIGADHEDHFRVRDVAHLVRHRAGIDAFHQRRDARRMAQARAVVDVVGPEAGAHQLLEQIRLFVRALGGTETGERPLAVGIARVAQALWPRRRALPPRWPRGRPRCQLSGSTTKSLCFGDARLADQRLGEAMRMLHVVEAVAALHAQPARVRRTVLALHVEDRVVLDVIGELAADAAVRTHRIDLLVGDDLAGIARGHQRAGRARLHALAAGDARRVAHRIVEVEHDLRFAGAEGVADDVVDLLFAAGAHAALALDAGVEVHRHRRMREVFDRLMPRREARLADRSASWPRGRARS